MRSDHTLVVPYEHLLPTPWRNGGGWSRVVQGFPADADGECDWRLSIARIDASGSFSTFPGIDRTLAVAGTVPLMLTVDGVRSTRAPGDVVAFPGEATVQAEVGRAGATVLNVMTARGRCSASVRTTRLHDGAPARVPGSACVVVLDGYATVDDGRRLGALDTLVAAAGTVTLRSPAALLAVVRTS